MVDEQRLMDFVGQAVGGVGGVLNGAMVVLGDRLGLYRAMAGGSGFADRAGASHCYVGAVRPRVAVGPGRPRVRQLRGRRSLLASR